MSILQDWVTKLPLRHQGVLLAAVRGCDGFPKENPSKNVVRAIRGAFLNPADERELTRPGSFMIRELTVADFKVFLNSWDQYPFHFIHHIMCAIEIIGYYHPKDSVKFIFSSAYFIMTKRLHVNVESKDELDKRLTTVRVCCDIKEPHYHSGDNIVFGHWGPDPSE